MLLTAWAICEGQGSAPPAEPKAENGGGTEIFSDNLVMVSREKDNYFLFTGNVEIHATNMVATCERLEVYASKDAEPSPEKKQDKEKEKEEAPIGKIERIMAIGKVRLIQQDRVATAGKAEIYPQE